ncbi:MAG: sortase [Candidatus Levybacteria bacterium]|nr:sortase [Candidatus Levybacteria bacterium]
MNKLFFHLGNILIVTSLFGFAYIFYPLLQVYIAPPVIQNVAAQKGTTLTIPKINAQAPVIEMVDPWNEALYDEALKRGVAHAKGTSLPGEDGTTFLFAHSSGMPWEMTRYNTIFLRLGELSVGDRITINRNGRELQYKVTDKKEVDPSEVNYLLQTNKTQLILQTCTPIGTSLKRLLIFAELG